MALDIAFLLISVVVMAISADRFVMGAARTAELARIPPIVVGVVIIGFGTGMPELITAVVASLHHHVALGMSSVIGSTFVNCTLVLGTLGALSAPRVSSSVLKREGLLQLLAVTVFALVAIYGHDRPYYSLLLVLLIAFVFWTISGSENRPENKTLKMSSQRVGPIYLRGIWTSIGTTLLGLAFVLGSAELLVLSATGVAEHLGVSKATIGITLVALGTSLPEWVTAIAAGRKGHSELVIGNVFGANLFNTTAVAGIAGLISPGAIDIPQLDIEVTLMVAASLAALLLLSSSRRLSRTEGWSMIAAYLVWLMLLSSHTFI